MKLLRAVFTFMLGLSAATVATENNTTPKLMTTITKKGTTYTIETRNTSIGRVSVSDVFLENSKQSGHWLFLYDPATRKIQEAWASTFEADMHGKEFPLKDLGPNESVKRSFSKQEITGYFMYVPKCYYLTALYRKRINGELIYSKASQPILECER